MRFGEDLVGILRDLTGSGPLFHYRVKLTRGQAPPPA